MSDTSAETENRPQTHREDLRHYHIGGRDYTTFAGGEYEILDDIYRLTRTRPDMGIEEWWAYQQNKWAHTGIEIPDPYIGDAKDMVEAFEALDRAGYAPLPVEQSAVPRERGMDDRALEVITDAIVGSVDFYTSPEGMAVAGAGGALFAGHLLKEQYAKIRHHYSEQPSFFDQREIKSREIFLRGHATVDEIFEASYGEWPVKGLNITSQNSQQVRIADIFAHGSEGPNKTPWLLLKNKAEYYAATLGHARIVGERQINLNVWSAVIKPALVGKSSLAGTFGHEATHIMQGDHYYRASDLFGEQDVQKLWRQGSMRSDEIATGVFSLHGAAPSSEISEKALKHRVYLQRGIEIQARLHEVMAEGYQVWGQLPSTPEHAVIAMKNMGADIPDDVMDSLRQMPDFEVANRTFSTVKMPVMMRDINFLKDTLTPTGRSIFWNETMPDLYSDLAGMYGDRSFDVRRRGLGPYPVKQVAAGAQQTFAGVFRNTADDVVAMTRNMGGPLAIGKDAVKHARNVHGGFVFDAVLGAGVGIAAFATGHSLQESGKISLEMVVPYAEAGLKALEGDRKGAIQSAMTETAGIGGAIAGATGGAVLGATIGSVVPLLGTGVGGIIGGIVGGVAGGMGIGMGTDVLLKRVPGIVDKVDDTLKIAGEFAGKARDGVVQIMTFLTGDVQVQATQRGYDLDRRAPAHTQ